MNKAQIEARRTMMKTLEAKPGYFETSYARQKKRRDSKEYVDERTRVA